MVLSNSRKSKEGSASSRELYPIVLCVPVGNAKSWYFSLRLLTIEAHADVHGERCALLSQFIHRFHLGRAVTRELHLPVPCLSPSAARVQSWVCYAAVHCCSANVSNKISRRSGQLFLHTEGSQWLLEPLVSPATAALGVVSKENPSAYKEVKEPLLAIEGAQRE